MNNEIVINNQCPLIEEKSNKKIKEKESSKNIDISTTKEEESFITEEIIQYCSSPKSGLVSINIANNINKNFTPIPTEKNRIITTITMNIALIKKEIDLDDIEVKRRSSAFHKKEEEKNNNKIKKMCYSNKIINDNNSNNNKSKSVFKDKKNENEIINTKKVKKNINNNSNKEVNKALIKKKISKTKKKKKIRKSLENNEVKGNEENEENKNERRLSLDIEDKKKKKKKKKKIKKMSKSKPKDENEIRNEEKNKEKAQEPPNIIILGFSSSDDCSNESNKNNNNSEHNSNKSIEIKDNVNKDDNIDNQKFHRIEGDFLKKRQKTIVIKKSNYLKNKMQSISERKIIIPKSKKSCHASSECKISDTKIFIKPTRYKFTSNDVRKYNKPKIKENYRSIFQITNNISQNKESEKDKIKRIFSKNDEENKPIKLKLRHSITKNFSANKQNDKLKNKIKQKDSIQSCKILNKSINYEKEKYFKKKGEKEKENTKEKRQKNFIKYINKSNKNLIIKSLRNSHPKNHKKNIYNSNKNITAIVINPKEDKDIHLVFEGKEETIINYTNQELVDDENEYMVECLKVLLKLKMEEQPRCKQKVNFNFSNEEKNKKIALFDLDDTLVHCTKEKKGLNGDSVNVKLPTNKIVSVGLNIRSHWKEALDLIKNHYNIVIYTASHQSYADAVLNYLDKENKYFQYRLYRNHCVQCEVDGIKFYVKDLDTLNKYYNLKDIVLIDNSVLSFAYHLNNGIPIVPFIEQKDDTQLLMLAYYLVSIASYDDLTQENKKHINIEHFLSMAKKLAEEEEKEIKKNNEVSDNVNENDNKNNNEKEKNVNWNDNINNNIEKEKNIIKDVEKENINKIDNNNKLLNLRKSNKFLIRKSQKALKIMEDMKKNLGDIYKNNYC